MKSYDILLGSKIVGKADITVSGLYYQFQCWCELSGDTMYHIRVVCGVKATSLGICVPMSGGFGINTRVPIKRIGEGSLSFYVVPRHMQVDGKFTPIKPDEPFEYLEKLKHARLEIRNGEYGVLIDEDQPGI